MQSCAVTHQLKHRRQLGALKEGGMEDHFLQQIVICGGIAALDFQTSRIGDGEPGTAETGKRHGFTRQEAKVYVRVARKSMSVERGTGDSNWPNEPRPRSSGLVADCYVSTHSGRKAEIGVSSPDGTIHAEHRSTDRCALRRLHFQQRTLRH